MHFVPSQDKEILSARDAGLCPLVSLCLLNSFPSYWQQLQKLQQTVTLMLNNFIPLGVNLASCRQMIIEKKHTKMAVDRVTVYNDNTFKIIVFNYYHLLASS